MGCKTLCCGAVCDIGEVPGDQGVLLLVLVLGRRLAALQLCGHNHVGQPAVPRLASSRPRRGNPLTVAAPKRGQHVSSDREAEALVCRDKRR